MIDVTYDELNMIKSLNKTIKFKEHKVNELLNKETLDEKETLELQELKEEIYFLVNQINEILCIDDSINKDIDYETISINVPNRYDSYEKWLEYIKKGDPKSIKNVEPRNMTFELCKTYVENGGDIKDLPEPFNNYFRCNLSEKQRILDAMAEDMLKIGMSIEEICYDKRFIDARQDYLHDYFSPNIYLTAIKCGETMNNIPLEILDEKTTNKIIDEIIDNLINTLSIDTETYSITLKNIRKIMEESKKNIKLLKQMLKKTNKSLVKSYEKKREKQKDYEKTVIDKQSDIGLKNMDLKMISFLNEYYDIELKQEDKIYEAMNEQKNILAAITDDSQIIVRDNIKNTINDLNQKTFVIQ